MPSEKGLLDIYLQDVRQVNKHGKSLSRAEELALARRIKQGDEYALEELVRRNLRFVISVAKLYQNKGLPIDDLVAEGNAGLHIAAKKFDPEGHPGVKFISYAVWWIKQAIKKALSETGENATVRIPLNQLLQLTALSRLRAFHEDRLGRLLTSTELAQLSGIDIRKVEMLQARSSVLSLDAPLMGKRDVSNPITILDLLDPSDISALTVVVTYEDDNELEVRQRILSELLDSLLTEREKRILTLYFGLNETPQHTLEEIGRMMGVTRERIRQLKEVALLKLRVAIKTLPSESAAALRSGIFVKD